jgi:hypothetical protein
MLFELKLKSITPEKGLLKITLVGDKAEYKCSKIETDIEIALMPDFNGNYPVKFKGEEVLFLSKLRDAKVKGGNKDIEKCVKKLIRKN